jgi:hypothetical protein
MPCTHILVHAAFVFLQGEELEPARQKAEAAGVKEIYIDDLREEFVRDFVFPMFRRAPLLYVIYSTLMPLLRAGGQGWQPRLGSVFVLLDFCLPYSHSRLPTEPLFDEWLAC